MSRYPVFFLGLVLLIIVAGSSATPGPKSNTVSSPGAQEIMADSLRSHVLKLADDALEGRGAGYSGEKKAAAYIVRQFKHIGLKSELQVFRFLPRAPERPGLSLTSRNVLALLQGSDPGHAREPVCVGAHHDGQGMAGQADGGRYPNTDPAAASDMIWNSADDNASSVAALLEIARVLAQRPSKTRRPIIFVTFGAEEHALNGSAYLAQNPWPAGSRCVAMVNLEKIGRVPDQPLVMAGCATSLHWGEVLRIANEGEDKVECLLPDLIPDTDHYPFGAVGIPSVVLGTVHEEDTHRPTDESSKIDFQALVQRTRYVLGFVETLANRESPPGFDPDANRGAGVIVVSASRAERAALGLGEHGALKVSVVLRRLPAAESGLRVGDFITALNGKPFDLRPDEGLVQEELSDNSSAKLTVRRGKSVMIVNIDTVPGK